MLRIDPKFSSFNSRYLNRLRTALIFGVLFSACGTTTPPLEVTAELPKNETPPTVYVPAGFYVFDSGSAYVDPNLSLYVHGIYSDASTIDTHVDYVHCQTSPTPITGNVDGPDIQFCIEPDYSTTETYSVFFGPSLTATIDQVWAYVPTDVTAQGIGIQLFASVWLSVTYPTESTVPAQLVTLSHQRKGPPWDTVYGVRWGGEYFGVTADAEFDPPPFEPVVTSPEYLQVPGFVPESICFSGPFFGTRLSKDSDAVGIEFGDGWLVQCGGDFGGVGLDVFIRGKLRRVPKPDNLSMVCTPGEGCEFSP